MQQQDFQDMCALPVVQYTDRHLDTIIAEDLSYTESMFFVHCLGNMIAKSGKLHEHSISDIAKKLGVQPCNFYGSDGYIAKLNRTGLVKLEIVDRRLTGSVVETATKRKRDKKTKSKYPLAVGVMHREAFRVLVEKTRKKSVLRMMLIMGLHTDKTTGILNTIMRPVEWGKLIGDYSRIICDRAVDAMIAFGLVSMDRDYKVRGKMPFVALAEGFLKMKVELDKERRAKEKAERKERKKMGLAEDPEKEYRVIEADLMKYFGLNAKGWTKAVLRQARERLLFFIKRDARKQIERFHHEGKTETFAEVLGAL